MKNDATDKTFRALSDANRRRMLDLLKERPGLGVGELSERFAFSRFAAMKHLRVLENAGLVVSRKEGRTRRLYLNAIPIQTIYDRWISRYSALWASRLTAMKYELEKEESGMKTNSLSQVYVVYIRTSPEKLWKALTDSAMTKQYFHGTEVRGDFRKGSSIDYMTTEEDGSVRSALSGQILESQPGKKLVHTFAFPRLTDEPTRVTYEIEQAGDAVKLTVTHDGFAGETETYTMVKGGWPPIFSGLKTLLETGEPLRIGA